MWLLTILIAIGAVGLVVIVHTWPALDSPFRVPWWLLAIMFYFGELAVVHLRFRRDAHSFSMSEIPLVVGLFFASPLTVILAQLLGTAVVLAVNRRQPRLKMAFNLGQFTVQTGLAIVVFRTFVALGDPLGPAGWGGALLATLVALLAADALINTAIRWSGGKLDRSEVVEVLALGAIAAAMNGSLALVGITVLWMAPSSAWLTLVPPAVLFLAYRAYSAQRQERDRLESLYRVTRVLHESPQLESALLAAASQARDMFEAEIAEITLFPAGPKHNSYRTAVGPGDHREVMAPVDLNFERGFWSDVIAGDAAVFLTEGVAGLARRAGDEAIPIEEAIVSPLTGDEGAIGIVLVANRLGDVSNFGPQDLMLLETLANQVSVSLENGRLEDSLAQLTELKEELRHQALHDSLTKLANRVLFTERVEHAMERCSRTGRMVAVLFLDLDDFKTINDSLGHGTGDLLLIAVGERLRASCRPADSIARLGGDEFAVLLEDLTGPAEATDVAQRIIESFAEPFDLDGKEVTTHASVGIAFGAYGQHPDRLLRNADTAMYAAKRRGKGTYQVFEASMHAEMTRRLELRAALKEAVRHEELSLYYQPVVSLDDGEIAGVEALLRWRHPQRGQVKPGQFIPFAEETGLIIPLGRWVLQEACRQARVWQELHEGHNRHLTMSVNLSPKQLVAPGLVEEVAEALDAYQLDPEILIFEITENVLMQTAARRLGELKELGVGLAIDDFGTGYSSLSYLDRLPIDMIKVDRTFVRRLGNGGEESPLVRTVIQIGDSLGLETVVEGIEAARQVERLRQLGCRRGQGYYFAGPMKAGALDGLLRQRLGDPTALAGEGVLFSAHRRGLRAVG